MLCAHYKLDGNVENTGAVSTVDTWTTEPTFEVGGIYEKSMTAGSMKWDAQSTANILNNNAFTWAAWVYVNPNVSIQTQPFFGNGTFGANNNRKFFINQSPTRNDITWSWMNDAGAITFIEGTLEGVLPDYEWTHVAITFGERTFKIYINGVCEFTQSGVKSESSSFEYITSVFYSNLARRLQDVRIYNEAISQEEVKELAYGLEEHEKCVSGLPGRVLVNKKTDTWASGGNWNFHTFNRNDGQEFKKNETYHITADVISTSGNFSQVTFLFYTLSKNTGYGQQNVTINNNKLEASFSPTDDCHDFLIYSGISGQAGSKTMTLENIKVEKQFKTNSDTPRYEKSTVIDSDTMEITSYAINKSNSLAISFWVKFNSNTNASFFKCAKANAYTKVHQINYTDDGTVLDEKDYNEETDGVSYKTGSLIANGGNTEYLYTPFAKQGIILSQTNGLVTLEIDDNTLNVGTVNDTNWHHFVINSSGKRVVDVYLDGEKVATGSPKSDVKIDRASSTEQTTFNGDLCVSDFRLYGKHLTDEMALRLYGISPDDYDLTK